MKQSSSYFVGVDVGGTKILVVVLDEQKRLIYRAKVPTRRTAEEIAELVVESVKQSSITLQDVQAVGVGVPGMADPLTGVVVDAPALKWRDYDLGWRMGSVIGCPVFVENDVNCAAVGEGAFGAARDMHDFVCIAIGTGLGGGIVANGQLIHGYRHMAGEIGYLADAADLAEGRSVGVNQFGFLEEKVSGSYLSSFGAASRDLFARYVAHDEEAISIVQPFLLHLSAAIANVVSLLNPQAVILGGGVAQSMDGVLGPIREWVSRATPIAVDIRLSELGEDAGVWGAAAYAMDCWKRTAIPPKPMV